MYLPKLSCAIVRFNDATNIQSTQINLREGVTRVIPYSFYVDRPSRNNALYSVSATVYVGWCGKVVSNKKNGDFENNERHDIELKDGQDSYIRNINVDCYSKY